MTCKNKLQTVFSVLLFIMMATFTVSSYAMPCHDDLVSEPINSKNYVPDETEILSFESIIVQVIENCEACKSKCESLCGFCKLPQRLAVTLSVIEIKKYNFQIYKSVDDKLQLIQTNKFANFKIPIKYSFLSSSIVLPLQTTLRHRVLLI